MLHESQRHFRAVAEGFVVQARPTRVNAHDLKFRQPRKVEADAPHTATAACAQAKTLAHSRSLPEQLARRLLARAARPLQAFVSPSGTALCVVIGCGALAPLLPSSPASPLHGSLVPF